MRVAHVINSHTDIYKEILAFLIYILFTYLKLKMDNTLTVTGICLCRCHTATQPRSPIYFFKM